MSSNSLDVTDWKIATCPSCERITRFVRGTCDHCGFEARDLADSGTERDATETTE